MNEVICCQGTTVGTLFIISNMCCKVFDHCKCHLHALMTWLRLVMAYFLSLLTRFSYINDKVTALIIFVILHSGSIQAGTLTGALMNSAHEVPALPGFSHKENALPWQCYAHCNTFFGLVCAAAVAQCALALQQPRTYILYLYVCATLETTDNANSTLTALQCPGV
jgi:hypothetical protein